MQKTEYAAFTHTHIKKPPSPQNPAPPPNRINSGMWTCHTDSEMERIGAGRRIWAGRRMHEMCSILWQRQMRTRKRHRISLKMTLLQRSTFRTVNKLCRLHRSDSTMCTAQNQVEFNFSLAPTQMQCAHTGRLTSLATRQKVTVCVLCESFLYLPSSPIVSEWNESQVSRMHPK